MKKSFGKYLMLLVLLGAVPYSAHAQSSFEAGLSQDETLQDAVIIAVRSALGARPQTTVVRRSSFIVEIGMYIDTYRATRNATTLENIQKRYAAAKSELLDARLPATIEELVLVLERLQTR